MSESFCVEKPNLLYEVNYCVFLFVWVLIQLGTRMNHVDVIFVIATPLLPSFRGLFMFVFESSGIHFLFFNQCSQS